MDPAAAATSLPVVLVTALVGIVIGGLFWGAAIKLLSGPIGQSPQAWGPSFKTGFIIAIVTQVASVALTFVFPILAILAFPIAFVIAMFGIHKFHGISLGRSALITLIAIVGFFVVMFVIGLVLAGVLAGVAAATN
jgi:hypothetical protein